MPDLDWQIHQKNIAGRGKYILDTELWSDCKFIVSNAISRKEFKAHKLILSMSSPVFEKMFQDCFNESENDIDIIDTQPEAFEAILKYIYADEIKIQSFDLACQICSIAHKYMMPELMKQCISYISNHLEPSNACRSFEIAKLFDQYDLMEKCRQVILSKTKAIASDPSFNEIQLSTLKTILQEEKLNIPETDLFKAVESWTQAEFERREICGSEHADKQQAVYDELLPHICFLSMTPSEFTEGPALSSMLTKDEALAIVMNLLSPNCSISIPNEFTKRTRIRNSVTHIQWPFKYSSNVFKSRSSSLEFNCNQDIEIVGVMIDGQGRGNKEAGDYEEELVVTLYDEEKHCSTARFRAPVKYLEMINVHFPSPVKILHSKVYRLVVSFQENEYCDWGYLNENELTYGSLKFSFLNIGVTLFPLSGIIISC